MTSLTGQFLSRLRKNFSLTAQNEPTLEESMLKMTIKDKRVDLAEATGVILGLIVGGIVSLLLGGWIIHWILTSIGIGGFTYGQVVGLLAIWEIIKPRSETK